MTPQKGIAWGLDVGMSEDARQEFAIFLQHPSKETRPSIQSTASQHLRLFGSKAVRRATDCSTFDLQDVIDGEPMTIYIIIPPTKLESHRSLLRLWLGSCIAHPAPTRVSH